MCVQERGESAGELVAMRSNQLAHSSESDLSISAVCVF